MKFETSNVYHMVTDELSYAGLPANLISNKMIDGRTASPWDELIATHYFKENLQWVGGKGRDLAYKDGSQMPVELRTMPLTATHLHTALSGHQGKNREYDAQEHEENLKKISGYLVVYPYNDYRHLFIFHVPVNYVRRYIPNKGLIPRKDLFRILGDPKSMYKRGRDLLNGKLNEMIVL